MNEISLLNKWIEDWFQAEELVNTVSIVPTIEMDLNKENIYPLVNIDFTDSDIQEQIIVASFKITVVNQREVRAIKTDSKLLENTNYIDNINETHSICEHFINNLTHQHNEAAADIDSISRLTTLKNWGRSGCDGFQFTIDISIPNKGKSC